MNNEKRARAVVYERSQGICEVCGRARATDYSHRKARSQGGEWDPRNALHACHECHMGMHSYPELAKWSGLMVHAWADPAEEPITRNDGDAPVWLTEDGGWSSVPPEAVAS